MTKPENCSAGGYCDCYQLLEKLGYWDEGKTFLGLSLTDEQGTAICKALAIAPPGIDTLEETIRLACREFVENHKT